MDKITKSLKSKRSQCSRKKTQSHQDAKPVIEYPPGPIMIKPSWNPVNRNEKPPYSYAAIIAHALLSSEDRKLTLNEIYGWITMNYPFYSNDTQGWQNSIRHNLSLHKAFVKIERDPTAQNPPRKGCFWTIRSGQEGAFIENLQKPINPVRKQLTSIGSKRSLKRGATGGGIEPTSPVTPYNTFRTSSSSSHSVSSKFSQPLLLKQQQRQNSSTSSSPEQLYQMETQLSSPTTSSSSSSSYHRSQQLYYNIPEYPVSYQVYPDHAHNSTDDLFGNDDTLTYSHYTDNHPPSLSPCDTYSTTSSYPDTYVTQSGSQDPYHNYAMFTNDSIYYPYKDYSLPTRNNYHGFKTPTTATKAKAKEWSIHHNENLYTGCNQLQPNSNNTSISSLVNKSYFTGATTSMTQFD